MRRRGSQWGPSRAPRRGPSLRSPGIRAVGPTPAAALLAPRPVPPGPARPPATCETRRGPPRGSSGRPVGRQRATLAVVFRTKHVQVCGQHSRLLVPEEEGCSCATCTNDGEPVAPIHACPGHPKTFIWEGFVFVSVLPSSDPASVCHHVCQHVCQHPSYYDMII